MGHAARSAAASAGADYDVSDVREAAVTAAKRQECKCNELIAEEYESLRVNVDAKWLTSSDWANAKHYAISLCPVHGAKS